jgi:predicted RNA-binding Zn ribbon-like protein
VLAERTGMVSGALGARLRRAAQADPGRAAAVFEQAVRLREAAYRLFLAEPGAADDPAPGADDPAAGAASGVPGGADVAVATAVDLATLQSAMRDAAVHRDLVAGSGGYALDWPDTAMPERVIWPLATSVVDVLLSADRARLKQCASDDCNWLFRDASRNRSRRWCEMSQCGNRAKARRYAARHG